MNQKLEREYYSTNNPKRDEFVFLLACVQAPYYFILENKVGDLTKYRGVFCKDTTFFLCFNEEGQSPVMDSIEEWDSPVFTTQYIKGRGEKAIQGMESLLDKGEMVIFQSYTSRLPFNLYFVSLDEPYDEIKHPAAHALVALGHDETQFFYLESPMMINRENFIPYKGSTSKGIISKKDSKPAFDCYLHYASVVINEQELEKYHSIQAIMPIYKKIMEHFIAEPRIIGEREYFFNNDAHKKLIEYVTKNPEVLLQWHEYHAMSMIKYIELCYTQMRSRKIIFIEGIKAVADQISEKNAKVLLEELQNSEKAVMVFVVKIRRAMIRNNVASYQELMQLLQNVMDAEQKAYEVMKRVYEEELYQY